MAKKKKTKLPSYLSLAAALLSLLAVVMIFLPAIAAKETDATYSGLQVAFGYAKKEPIVGEIVHLNFSFMNLLTYLLPLAALVLLALNAFGKKPNKLFTLIAAICLVVAAVFFFSTLGFASFNDDVTKALAWLGGDIKEGFKLGIGSILGGILSILGALSAAATLVLNK